MKSGFFHFQHTFNRLLNKCIKFLLKYERGGGGGSNGPHLSERTTKSLDLLRLNKKESKANAHWKQLC